MELTISLDILADNLQAKGLLKEAETIDIVSNTLEKQAATVGAKAFVSFPEQYADEIFTALQAAANGDLLKGRPRTVLKLVMDNYLNPQFQKMLAKAQRHKAPEPGE
jgi:hypothetical protein